MRNHLRLLRLALVVGLAVPPAWAGPGDPPAPALEHGLAAWAGHASFQAGSGTQGLTPKSRNLLLYVAVFVVGIACSLCLRGPSRPRKGPPVRHVRPPAREVRPTETAQVSGQQTTPPA